MISLEEAKVHLRVDEDCDDTYIEVLIQAATEMAQAHLNRPLYVSELSLQEAKSNGPVPDHALVMNAAIRSAILLLLGNLYRNREGVTAGSGQAELPLGVRYVLGLYRWLPGV